MKKLKVLIVSQYFWPENMRINELVADFMQKGHEVTVLTGMPNYPSGDIFNEYKSNPKNYSNYHGAKIIRVPLIPRKKNIINLALNYLSFFVNASFLGAYKLRDKKFDSIFVYAVSPIMAAIPAIIIGKLTSSPVFVWVLDLWPDTLRALGYLNNKFLYNLLGKMVSWIYNSADYIFVQSNAFKPNILSYCSKDISADRITYYPHWAEDIFNLSTKVNIDHILEKKDATFDILFAGNIGESQDFPAIIEAFSKLAKTYPTIRLIVVGDGRMYSWVDSEIKALKLNNIKLTGRFPLEYMPAFFEYADALLVTLKTNDIFSKTIPAKLQAYLAAGKPILGMINGEAAQLIQTSEAGLVCNSGDSEQLIKNILSVFHFSQNERKLMGDKGKEFYHEHFRADILFNKLEHFFYTASRR